MALWVLFGHVALSFDIRSFSHSWWWLLLEANQKAVDVFIILSGFVIFHLLYSKREPYAFYLYRRFLRLFPAYLICLLISVAMVRPSMVALQMLDGNSARKAARIQIFSDSITHFWPQIIAHVTMLHGLVPSRLLPSASYAFIGQAWSVSVEWQFYILAPLIYLLATGKERWQGWSILLVGSIILMIANHAFGSGFIGGHVVYFAIGCGSSFLWRAKSNLIPYFARHSNLLIPLGTLLVALACRSQWQIAIWFCVLASCLTVNSLGRDKIVAHLISSLLTTRPLRWVGRISYSVYLTHMIALYGMLWLLRNSGESQVMMLLTTLVGTLVITLTASHFMYEWVELPFIEIGRKFRRALATAEPVTVPEPST
jgi:peptidoglycan/LPS O-acetylase OafA/YrhL